MSRPFVLVMLAACFQAQTAESQPVPLLNTGDTVRFNVGSVQGPLMGPLWRVGTVERITPDTLVVRAPHRGSVREAFSLDSVFLLYVSRGRESKDLNAGVYAASGALAGLALYAAWTVGRGNGLADKELSIRRFLGPLVVGGGVGLVVGFRRPGPHHWVEVQLPPVRGLRSEPQ